MAMTTAATRMRPALSTKLLIDTNARRVLFAEASKDVVDFLFSLLSLPVGTTVKLHVLETGSTSMVGSAGNLYASVLWLDKAYVLPGADLAVLVHPTFSSLAAAANMSLLRLPDPLSKEFLTCGHCHSTGYVMDVRGTKAATRGGAKGFVQGVVTYTVKDDLTVTPMSAISSMTLLNTLGVRDFGALQEKTVRLGSKEGLAILKASLHSKTVLTDVFLGKKPKAKPLSNLCILINLLGDPEGVAVVQDRALRRFPRRQIHLAPSI